MMIFLQSIGIGLGIGVVHSLALLCTAQKTKRDDDTIELMRDRNELDRQKVQYLKSIAESQAHR